MDQELTSDSNILLRASDVAGWKAEWESIDQNIKGAEARVKELQKRKATLATLLNGAVAFVPDLKEWLERVQNERLEREARDAPEDVALTDAILKVLKRAKQGSRDLIKQQLPANGYSLQKIQANPNYLYTAIGRLIARGQITEDPPGTYRLKE